MSSPRYTIRLPEPLHSHVQEHLRTSGTPFAVLICEALSVYLADSAPTAMPTAVPTAAPTVVISM